MMAGMEHLREALELSPAPVRRAEIAMVLAGAHRGMSDFTGAVDVLEDELDRLGDVDADMARILESELLHNAVQGAAAPLQAERASAPLSRIPDRRQPR